MAAKFMKPTIYFPVAQMILCAGAAAVYAVAGDWRKAVYWACAGVITAMVTF